MFVSSSNVKCFIQKRELVAKLTLKEIQKARETFFAFDLNRGGTISEIEARKTFREWFIFLYNQRCKFFE